MTGREQGFLLLTSHLGDPNCKPLTVAQFRTLAQRVQASVPPVQDRELKREDLLTLGYDKDVADNILFLLSRAEQLEYYVNQAKRANCYPVVRFSQAYPKRLRDRLGLDAPGSLWMKGDAGLLEKPAVALVGSRDLLQENYAFAREVGIQAAKQGFVLVSGNARGADQTAQQACLAAGGQVISIVADRLTRCPGSPNILYISEDGFDEPFSSFRALSRNRLIHAMGAICLVAQCTHGRGGTWQGTQYNLSHHLSPVYCFCDGSKAYFELIQKGAQPVDIYDLQDFSALQKQNISFFD